MRILKDRSPAIAPVKLFERYGVIRMEVEANSHELRHLISRSWKAGVNYVKTAIHLWESGHPFLCLLIFGYYSDRRHGSNASSEDNVVIALGHVNRVCGAGFL